MRCATVYHIQVRSSSTLHIPSGFPDVLEPYKHYDAHAFLFPTHITPLCFSRAFNCFRSYTVDFAALGEEPRPPHLLRPSHTAPTIYLHLHKKQRKVEKLRWGFTGKAQGRPGAHISLKYLAFSLAHILQPRTLPANTTTLLPLLAVPRSSHRASLHLVPNRDTFTC